MNKSLDKLNKIELQNKLLNRYDCEPLRKNFSKYVGKEKKNLLQKNTYETTFFKKK